MSNAQGFDSKAAEWRYVTSLMLFFTAGFLISLEVFTASAFLQHGRSLAEQAWMLRRFVGLAVLSLGLATLASPDHRSLKAGRTIILGTAVGLLASASPYAMVPIRDLTWQLGLINLAIVLGIGIFMFRRGGGILPGMKRRSRA